MESIERARKAIALDNFTNVNLAKEFGAGGNAHIGETLTLVLDAIEAEIAERCMELPLDADGVPIHCGDRIMSEDGRKFEVFLIGVSTLMTRGYTYYNHAEVSHYKPSTLEDILQSAGVSIAAIEDVAADIRELLGVE